MKRTILPLALCCLLWYTAGNGQSGPSTGTPSGRADSAYPAPADPVPTAFPQASPVSYASVTQLNNMLSQLEAVSKNTQTDLRKLRIDRWKTDGSNKKQVLGQVDSIQRNLQDALPGMIAALRTSPE